MSLNVHALADIKKNDTVVVTAEGAMPHHGSGSGAIPRDGILATALEDIPAGRNGAVKEWARKSRPE